MSDRKADLIERNSLEAKQGSIAGSLQDSAFKVFNTSVNILNRVLPPERREGMKKRLTEFGNDRPYLAAFLLLQVLISGFPILLFLTMTITVAVFAITTGILLGLIGAVFFIMGSIGFALIFLLPTLFFTAWAAVGIWFGGMCIYQTVRLFNQKDLSNRNHSLSKDGKTLANQNYTGQSEKSRWSQ